MLAWLAVGRIMIVVGVVRLPSLGMCEVGIRSVRGALSGEPRAVSSLLAIDVPSAIFGLLRGARQSLRDRVTVPPEAQDQSSRYRPLAARRKRS